MKPFRVNKRPRYPTTSKSSIIIVGRICPGCRKSCPWTTSSTLGLMEENDDGAEGGRRNSPRDLLHPKFSSGKARHFSPSPITAGWSQVPHTSVGTADNSLYRVCAQTSQTWDSFETLYLQPPRRHLTHPPFVVKYGTRPCSPVRIPTVLHDNDGMDYARRGT